MEGSKDTETGREREGEEYGRYRDRQREGGRERKN